MAHWDFAVVHPDAFHDARLVEDGLIGGAVLRDGAKPARPGNPSSLPFSAKATEVHLDFTHFRILTGRRAEPPVHDVDSRMLKHGSRRGMAKPSGLRRTAVFRKITRISDHAFLSSFGSVRRIECSFDR